VDLTDPTRALTPTLDGPVLAVLALSGRPLTVGQIAAQAARGSEIGVRRSVTRLVRQGIVTATQMGRNQVHELNRDHIAAAAAEHLAGLRLELWRRLRETLGNWEPKPVYACAFGSAARGDGGPDSDIDVLLVHRPFPGDKPPPNGQEGLADMLSEAFITLGTTRMTGAEAETWQSQVDDLHTKVRRWTGNPLQVVDVSFWQWASPSRTEPALFAEIDRDGITLAGATIPWLAKVL
jgi:DNA-binding transcriptional ArsR family regulator